MFDFRRTHNCGTLNESHIDTTVTLSGWVNRRRDHGGLIFIDLRDRFGITQLVFDPKINAKAHEQADALRSEWVISVRGNVIPRAEGMTNPKLATGAIEIEVTDFSVLSKALTPPFSVCDDTIDVNEELRLTYRYLDIRRGPILDNLIIRSKALLCLRSFLESHGFIDVQTPLLGPSTPEGSRDYVVPSRVHPGHFYALAQSPQLFKQLLMVSGVDRYYQVALCLRDEDLRADRQPEFSQLDLEMSFCTTEELFPLMEDMLAKLFKDVINHDLPTSFPRITYAECMEHYGTDKPDLRFGMKLHTVDHIASRSTFSVFINQLEAGCTVKGLCLKGGSSLSRRMIDDYTKFVGLLGIQGLAWMKHTADGLTSNIVKFFSEELQQELIETFGSEEGDLLFFIADLPEKANQALDHLRRKLAKDQDLIPAGTYAPLWVTEFPLFSWNSDEGRLNAEHHPFSAPMDEDVHYLKDEPLKARANAYDLVLNGYELASGSQRIHDSEVQKTIFQTLELSEEEINQRFGFFVQALRYGTPPHLGCAFGIERLVMILTGSDNIRDVVAFPKTQKASDLMSNAPSIVPDEHLDELRIQLHPQQG